MNEPRADESAYALVEFEPRHALALQQLSAQVGRGCLCAANPDSGGARAWSVALLRDEQVVAAAWSVQAPEEGGRPHLVLIGNVHTAGEEGLGLLLAGARARAAAAGQRQLEICIPHEEPAVLRLIEGAHFRVHSSFGYGGIADMVLDVPTEEPALTSNPPG